MFDQFTCSELRVIRAELRDPAAKRSREELLDDLAMVDLISAELNHRQFIGKDQD